MWKGTSILLLALIVVYLHDDVNSCGPTCKNKDFKGKETERENCEEYHENLDAAWAYKKRKRRDINGDSYASATLSSKYIIDTTLFPLKFAIL